MTIETEKSYSKWRKFFAIYYFITVPCCPSMAVASVIITLATPASMAERAFSILGSIPPLIVPSDSGDDTIIIIRIAEHTFLLK